MSEGAGVEGRGREMEERGEERERSKGERWRGPQLTVGKEIPHTPVTAYTDHNSRTNMPRHARNTILQPNCWARGR